jgi:hypothetical protein
MDKYIYKIRHIPTGKFIRIKLQIEGVKVWHEKNVISGQNTGYGKVLYDTHKGWSTPPIPSNEDFALIDCEIVKYKIGLIEQ